MGETPCRLGFGKNCGEKEDRKFYLKVAAGVVV